MSQLIMREFITDKPDIHPEKICQTCKRALEKVNKVIRHKQRNVPNNTSTLQSYFESVYQPFPNVKFEPHCENSHNF